MHAGFVNLPDKDRYDGNGDLCGMLIVRSGIKNLNIDSPMRHRQINKEGEYWVILQPGASYVDIKKVDYAPYMLSLRESIGKIESGKVYEAVIDSVEPEAGEMINISIISQPADAEKWLDGKLLGTGNGFTIKKGRHTLEIKKTGYKTLSQQITIDEKNFTFNDLKLSEVEPVMITIKSTSSETDIYINNVNEGKTNKQLFKFPGDYNLRLVADKYDTIEETITVTESGNNVFDYTLQKNTSLLTINTIPSNCEIYLNNEKLTGSSKEVSAGMYRVEVKNEGYYEQSRTISVEKGKNKTETFTLEQKTGKLQFVVEPMEAQVTLKQSSNTVQSWSGSKYLGSLPIGSYSIIVTCNDYASQTKQVKVNLDETAKVNMTLEKGTQPPQSPYLGGSTEGMIFVQGGTFQMGSNDGESDEKPIHSVTVSDFYIGKYEVTQKEWQDIMGNNPSNWKGDNLPVEKVSWYDAVEFCNKKSEKEGLQKCYSGSGKNITCDFTKNGYRLPTEAEWEYAARGGTESENANSRLYSGSNNIGDVAWYSSNSGSKTHQVGTKQANELGIHDMSGNVWEWCWDWYDKNYYSSSPGSNPRGPNSGEYSVLRGGSWFNYDYYCRVANRVRINRAGSSGYYYGMRISRTAQ